MRARRPIALALVALGCLALAAGAFALKLRAGDIIIFADGGFTPTKLPRHEDAPITIHGGVKIKTVSGELPPILETIEVEFDRHGSVETEGLPVCRPGQLEATTVDQARRACSGAIVGKGSGSAIVKFPEQAPIPASSPITIFNGPKKHGNPTVLAHAYLDHPIVTTFIVPVVIERIHKGHLRLPDQSDDPEDRQRRRHPDLRLAEDRQKVDLQGQEAQLRQRPLRNRPAPGPRQGPLQGRHDPERHLPQALSGAWMNPALATGPAPARPRQEPRAENALYAFTAALSRA